MNECWEFDISLRQFLIEWGGIDNNKLKEYIQKAIIEKYGFILETKLVKHPDANCRFIKFNNFKYLQNQNKFYLLFN
jgi:hypothetical protein